MRPKCVQCQDETHTHTHQLFFIDISATSFTESAVSLNMTAAATGNDTTLVKM